MTQLGCAVSTLRRLQVLFLGEKVHFVDIYLVAPKDLLRRNAYCVEDQ